MTQESHSKVAICKISRSLASASARIFSAIRPQPYQHSILKLAGLAALLTLPSTFAWSQHEHATGADASDKVAAPTVFLDKSPRVVAFQLKRLSNAQLLLIETATNDVKYTPVFAAILARDGMSPAAREAALAGLVAVNDSDPVTELINTLAAITGSDPAAKRSIDGLAKLLLRQPASDLEQAVPKLQMLCTSSSASLRAVGYAAWLVAEGDRLLPGNSRTDPPQLASWTDAQEGNREVDWLHAIPLVPDSIVRGKLHSVVAGLLQVDVAEESAREALDVQSAALQALCSIETASEVTFQLAAGKFDRVPLRDAAVKTLLSVDRKSRNATQSLELIAKLVDLAEQTPAPERTSPAFLDAMELVDQLLAAAPSETAKQYRARLRETVVRVVRIHTVEEEMRFDIPYFAVEAGRPVQVVLINEDMMPHNLVVTRPGQLQSVAEAGLATGPDGGLDGKQYVPHSDDVLFATNMVAAGETETLTFTAPEMPGEYPYVCTFPRHWMRMYGVMVVVPDLDVWQKNPTIPKDPIGSNRSFVQSWTVQDFENDLPGGLQARSPAIGSRLFVEATCAQCHRAGEHNVGNVGPELTGVFEKWKGNTTHVLRELLDPSHHVDEKYAMYLVLTAEGDTMTGLIVADTPDELSLLDNPESSEPIRIAKTDIDDLAKSTTSMMPKGLLDRFSRDEVLEILAYICNLKK